MRAVFPLRVPNWLNRKRSGVQHRAAQYAMEPLVAADAGYLGVVAGTAETYLARNAPASALAVS